MDKVIKFCCYCKQDRPVSLFYPNSSRCKPCEFERGKKRTQGRYAERREYFLKYQKEYKQKNPEKIKARLLVKEAIKKGILPKQPCVECGDVNSKGHHPNYSKPLEVVWLCQKHHQRVHAELKK